MLNTLAAIQAARGDLAEARQNMLESMTAGGSEEMRREDWLVYGMIAAGYGLDGVARAAFARIKPEPFAAPVNSHDIATRWLARLTAKCPPSKSAQPAHR